MAYPKPGKGDVRVSGPLTEPEALELWKTVAETVTRMGHGKTMRYYVAKYGSSLAVYRKQD